MNIPIEQLAQAFRDLKLELEETRAEAKELKLLLKEARSQINSSTKETKPSKTKPVKTRRSTGVRDSEGDLVYYSDLVALLKSSTGGFLKRNKFQEGDVVEVYGVTRIGYLKIRDPHNHKDNTTRKGDYVTLLEQ